MEAIGPYMPRAQTLSQVQLFATHGLQPTRLPFPWNSPGKNTGVGCHFLLQGSQGCPVSCTGR